MDTHSVDTEDGPDNVGRRYSTGYQPWIPPTGAGSASETQREFLNTLYD